jgi:hypothetical protein
MTTYYTDAAKVSSALGLIDGATKQRLTFGASTKPSLTEVETIINEMEDEIDRRMNHAWRATSISEELYGYDGFGILYLKKRPIQGPFESGTDKIECWNDSTWYDLVANLTEGRGEDFYVDYTRGWIFFLAYSPRVGDDTIRLTYVHGESSVPGWVQRLATKMTALALLETDPNQIILPTGMSSETIDAKISRLDKQIDNIISRESYIPYL